MLDHGTGYLSRSDAAGKCLVMMVHKSDDRFVRFFGADKKKGEWLHSHSTHDLFVSSFDDP